MRSAVRDAAKYFPTAIISGRSRDKVGASFTKGLKVCRNYAFAVIII